MYASKQKTPKTYWQKAFSFKALGGYTSSRQAKEGVDFSLKHFFTSLVAGSIHQFTNNSKAISKKILLFSEFVIPICSPLFFGKNFNIVRIFYEHKYMQKQPLKGILG